MEPPIQLKSEERVECVPFRRPYPWMKEYAPEALDACAWQESQWPMVPLARYEPKISVQVGALPGLAASAPPLFEPPLFEPPLLDPPLLDPPLLPLLAPPSCDVVAPPPLPPDDDAPPRPPLLEELPALELTPPLFPLLGAPVPEPGSPPCPLGAPAELHPTRHARTIDQWAWRIFLTSSVDSEVA